MKFGKLSLAAALMAAASYTAPAAAQGRVSRGSSATPVPQGSLGMPSSPPILPMSNPIAPMSNPIAPVTGSQAASAPSKNTPSRPVVSAVTRPASRPDGLGGTAAIPVFHGRGDVPERRHERPDVVIVTPSVTIVTPPPVVIQQPAVTIVPGQIPPAAPPIVSFAPPVVFVAPPAAAVRRPAPPAIGTPREDAIRRLGDPIGYAIVRGVENLFFEGGLIVVIQGDRVSAVK